MGRVTLKEPYNVYPFSDPENTDIIYVLGGIGTGMNVSLQQAVLLVLGGLVPVAVFIADRSELVVAVSLVNVLLIWASLRVATGGSLPGMSDGGAADPDQA
jgi:hypothetical protein